MLLIQLRKNQTAILRLLQEDLLFSIRLLLCSNSGTEKFSALKKLLKKCAIILQYYSISGKEDLSGKDIKLILCLVDPDNPWTVSKENILYKCGWSPFEGTTFRSKVVKTIVNGTIVYDNGVINEDYRGQRLLFDR